MSVITFGYLLYLQSGRSYDFSFVYFENLEDAVDVGSAVPFTVLNRSFHLG